MDYLRILNIARDRVYDGLKADTTPMRKASSTHNLRRCVEGITTIEFAFLAPCLLLLIMGIVEFSMIMFTMTVLESATSNTARLGKTGYTAAGSTRQQQIVANVANRTAGLLNASKITVTTQVYSNFDKIGQPEPCITHSPCPGTAGVNFQDINGNGTWDSDMAAAGLGNAGDVVVYTVSYPWPITTPMIGAITGNPFIISARTVVKNEPYGSD